MCTYIYSYLQSKRWALEALALQEQMVWFGKHRMRSQDLLAQKVRGGVMGGCAAHCMCQCTQWGPSCQTAPSRVSGSCWCNGLRCPGQAHSPSPMTAGTSPAALTFSSRFRGCVLPVVPCAPHAMDWCGEVTGAIRLPPSTLGHPWGGAGERLGAGGCDALHMGCWVGSEWAEGIRQELGRGKLWAGIVGQGIFFKLYRFSKRLSVFWDVKDLPSMQTSKALLNLRFRKEWGGDVPVLHHIQIWKHKGEEWWEKRGRAESSRCWCICVVRHENKAAWSTFIWSSIYCQGFERKKKFWGEEKTGK